MAKRIAILTGGGDAPGLNGVIRAVVRAAENEYDAAILGIRHGFEGFLEEDGLLALGYAAVHDILPKGGTILGAANRGNPFARKVTKDGEEFIEDVSGQVVDRIRELELDGLIVVGGDGTLGIARDLYQVGVPVVGFPRRSTTMWAALRSPLALIRRSTWPWRPSTACAPRRNRTTASCCWR